MMIPGLYQSHFMFHTLQIDKSKQQATNNDDSSKIVTKNRHAKVKSRRHSKNISNQKSLGIPTPSLSKSKQSIQFTRFLLFTSVCRCFFLRPKRKRLVAAKRVVSKRNFSFSRGSIFRLGGVKACGSISWKFLLKENMESELEIVGGYCLDMSVCFASRC